VRARFHHLLAGTLDAASIVHHRISGDGPRRLQTALVQLA
jgi:hypothetical protein